MRSTQRRLVWFLLFAAVLLLFVAFVSAVLYVVLRQRTVEVSSWQDPISRITPLEISPDLALFPLAGASEAETVDAAIANGDLETAYATLVFSNELSDGQRIGRLIILGRRLAETERLDRAGLVYQQIYDVSILSPKLTDLVRADALLAAGKGWADVGATAKARGAFDQVYVIAVESPYLQMADRRELLATLKSEYLLLGEDDRGQAVQWQLVELGQKSRQPMEQPAKLPELPGGNVPVSTVEVGALEEARRQAAMALIESYSSPGGPPPALHQEMAQALRAEDGAKTALYLQELTETTQPGRRIAVLGELIRWLSVKYQVATKGYGLSLVPEWEEEAPAIQSMLSKAYEDLFFEYEDAVTALPDASLIGPGKYMVRRGTNQAGRVGQYPNYPAQQMAAKLREAAQGLTVMESQSGLFVDVISEADGLRFYLNPAERYGEPPEAP